MADDDDLYIEPVRFEISWKSRGQSVRPLNESSTKSAVPPSIDVEYLHNA
jgi:hypothetical protein